MRNRTAADNPRSPRKVWAYLALPAAAAVGVAGMAIVPAVNAQNNGSSLSSGSSLGDGFTPGTPPQRSVVDTTYPDIANLPEGVEVDRVEWFSPRHVALFINSAAMPGEPIQVQMLLARDWHANPTQSFPEVWALDGLRARDDENGWTIETNIIQQFADKNVNVILPVGGESSFYADWNEPSQGKHYMWESFLTKELVSILDNGYRSNQTRAVVGISMGGTAAMNLAQRNPHLFDFVGSFSGYLDTTTSGMPQAIAAAQMDAGGYSAQAMWGPYGSQRWIDHDPKLGVDALRDMTVYVSSGSGRDDFGQADSVARGPANMAGIGLEAISRMSTQTFVDYAKAANVDVITKFRPSGVHSWEYWQYEMTQAWPYIADAMNLPEEDRGAECAPIGAIANVSEQANLGACINNEYDVADGAGKAQDFRSGTAYWSPETGAHGLFGAINTTYASLDGPNGWLGFPTTGETRTPDGKGRFVHFENGSIYWSPQTGAHAIPGDMFAYWGKHGYENSHIKYPVEPAQQVGEGLVQKFENGWLTRNPEGDVHFIVHGAIAEKYGEIDTANSQLGFPTSNEITIRGGAFQQFENGNIYWSPSTGAHVIYYGDIFDRWGHHRWEQGKFGFPTTDMSEIDGGGLEIEFENGRIRQLNGVIHEEEK